MFYISDIYETFRISLSRVIYFSILSFFFVNSLVKHKVYAIKAKNKNNQNISIEGKVCDK